MTAIVIGGNHHNTLGLIRSLGRMEVNSSVILCSSGKAEDNYVLKSKYVADYEIVADDAALLRSLLKRKKEKEQVVICTSDYAASVIDRNQNVLKPYFKTPGCREQGFLTMLMDKKKMQSVALQCGLSVPSSFEIMKESNLPKNITYPCIVKPSASIGGVKADIGVFYSEAELREHISKCTAKTLHIERFIDKTIEYQLIGCSLNNGNDVIIPGRSRIISQPICTNTGYLHYEHLDGTEPISQCQVFLKQIGYSGLFSMEFLRDSNGDDFFMEINFRNDGNSICVTESGVNLPYIWYLYNLGEDWKSVPQSIKREVFVMPEYTELGLWYRGEISFNRMVKEFREANVFMEYASYDPNPTMGKWEFRKKMTTYIIKKPIKRILKALSNGK